MIINYILPVPPSSNMAYPTNFKTKKRYKSQDALDWEKEAFAVLSKQKRFKCSGNEKLKVVYTFFTSWMTKKGKIKKKDIENYVKLLSDFLCKNIEGMDDCQFWEMTTKKMESDQDIVHVMISEI